MVLACENARGFENNFHETNHANLAQNSIFLFQLRNALRDQKEVNVQLRNYIDGILMNIIEKYPELLEVRK